MTTPKTARAEVRPRRQRTQYSCMACSMAMCLTANGIDADEDTVNEVMGARPMKGAAWEQALACAQHYGMRATLTVPATLSQVKAWTDNGVPVMIAWNPEGREWSHASVVVDVVPDETHGFLVHVADPNIPDPEQTIRVVTKDDFYKKWYEKWPNYLVRRPAMAVEREVTTDGRQVMASMGRQSAYRNWEKERFKRQELRHELRHERSYGGGGSGYDQAYISTAERKKQRYHYVMFAEQNGLNDVMRWYEKTLKAHQSLAVSYVPPAVDDAIRQAPNKVDLGATHGAQDHLLSEVKKALTRTVFEDELNPDEAAELRELEQKYPGLKSTNQGMADTTAYAISRIDGEVEKFLDLEAMEHAAVEQARPYAVDPKYRRNWHHYTWSDADYPYEWRWNYIDEDGMYVHVAAKVRTNFQTNKDEIEDGRARVAVYKFAPEEVRGLRRDTDENMVQGKAELVTRGFIRTRDPEEVIPRTMPFILKIKGERGFDDDDLRSRAVLIRERRRQQALERARKREEEIQRQEEERRQRQNKTVVDSALAEKFSILDRLIAQGDAAAKASANEVKAVYEAGGRPTEDQLKRLRNMLYRTRMRGEADHFRVASLHVEAKRPTPVQPKKDKDTVSGDAPARRNPVVQQMIERGSAGAGKHHNREDDVEKGRSRKPKHKKRWEDRDAETLTAAWGDTL